MNIETVLAVLVRYLPDLSLSEAMSIATELSASAPRATLSIPTDALATWLRAYDSEKGYGYVAEHRIQAIKALREAFRVNGQTTIGLKEAKDAVDAYAGPFRYTAF